MFIFNVNADRSVSVSGATIRLAVIAPAAPLNDQNVIEFTIGRHFFH